MSFHGNDFIGSRCQRFGSDTYLGDGSKVISESLNFFVCKGGMMIVLASDPGCRSQVGCQDVKFFKNSNPLGDC